MLENRLTQNTGLFRGAGHSLGIYEEFVSLEGLKTKVSAALSKAVDRLNNTAVKSTFPEEAIIQSTDNSLVEVSEFDEDIGLFELSEIVFEALENFTDTLDNMRIATEKLSNRITARTEELAKLKPTGDPRKDQKTAKQIIEKVASEMHRYSQILDSETPEVQKEFLSALRGMQHAIIISKQDGIASPHEIVGFMHELHNLKDVLDTVHDNLSAFHSAVFSVPRMSSKLNQAKRRTIKSIESLTNFLSEASSNTETTIKAIKQEP